MTRATIHSLLWHEEGIKEGLDAGVLAEKKMKKIMANGIDLQIIAGAKDFLWKSFL